MSGDAGQHKKANQIRPCQTERTRESERGWEERKALGGRGGWDASERVSGKPLREDGITENEPKSDPATQTTTGGMFQTGEDQERQ